MKKDGAGYFQQLPWELAFWSTGKRMNAGYRSIWVRCIIIRNDAGCTAMNRRTGMNY